jgi:hypothetical protein
MAERTVVVCDICGKPAEQSVTFRVGTRSLSQDLCHTHLQELVRQSHAPKRGRRPGALSVPSRKTPAKKSSGGASSPRSSRRRGTSKSTRKRITDPTALEKRRAALAKAREALAKKRAEQRAG